MFAMNTFCCYFHFLKRLNTAENSFSIIYFDATFLQILYTFHRRSPNNPPPKAVRASFRGGDESSASIGRGISAREPPESRAFPRVAVGVAERDRLAWFSVPLRKRASMFTCGAAAASVLELC